MSKSNIKDLEERIRNASPLDLASALQEAELYDKEETQKVVDQVYEEFSKSGNLVDEVVVPVFLSVADGLLESTAATRKLRKKGLTATKIVSQCKSFSYDAFETDSIVPDGYTEWKNARDFSNEYGENVRTKYTNNREVYEDKDKMDAYKDKAFNENGGRINATDEYTGKKNIYKKKAHPDARRNIQEYKHSHLAETDHIVPLEKIHKQFAGNYALTDEDIKNIANQDTNFALTSAAINRGEGMAGKGRKLEMTNPEFIKDQNKREKEGRPNQGLSEEAKTNMLHMHKQAQNAINKDANEAVLNNLTNQGIGDTSQIWGTAAENAANQSKEYIVGNVILYIIKPLYFEISDMFKNGIKEGVGAETVMQAFKIRFKRVKDYVLKNALAFIGDNMWEFIKGFVSSLVEGIISLFVGVFKQILKAVKEGIKVFVQAGKVLFGKEASEMTAAQKGNAIIKILGGSVIAICGIGLEALMNKIGIMEPWSIVLSTMLAGIASTLFMLLLDKLDLFNEKGEKRRMRIDDIFNERINDIQEAMDAMDKAAIETMRSQRLEFSKIRAEIREGIEKNNIDDINLKLQDLAKFMGVDLGYYDLPTFVENFDTMEIVL